MYHVVVRVKERLAINVWFFIANCIHRIQSEAAVVYKRESGCRHRTTIVGFHYGESTWIFMAAVKGKAGIAVRLPTEHPI